MKDTHEIAEKYIKKVLNKLFEEQNENAKIRNSDILNPWLVTNAVQANAFYKEYSEIMKRRFEIIYLEWCYIFNFEKFTYFY